MNEYQATLLYNLAKRTFGVPYPAARVVSVNTDFLGIYNALFTVRTWLENTHNHTFGILTPFRIDCSPEYFAIKLAIAEAGYELSSPTNAYCPGDMQPGSFLDKELLAVKEVTDPAVLAHELAHLWTNTGNEVHGEVDPYDPFGKASVLGNNYTAFPQVKLLSHHLQMAVSNKHIKSLP